MTMQRLLEASAAVGSALGASASSIGNRLAAWSDAVATFCIVALALGAGIAAAYGRELHAGRSPGRSWWVARLLLLPLLAISATAASEAFNLSRSTTAFTAAMLSLGGYDCLRLVEAHWRTRLGELGRANRLPEETIVCPTDGESDGASRG